MQLQSIYDAKLRGCPFIVLSCIVWCEWPRSQHRHFVRVAQVSTPTLSASGPGLDTDAFCEWPRSQHRRLVRVAQVSTPTLCASGPGLNTDAWCEWPRSQHRRLVRVAQVLTPSLKAAQDQERFQIPPTIFLQIDVTLE